MKTSFTLLLQIALLGTLVLPGVSAFAGTGLCAGSHKANSSSARVESVLDRIFELAQKNKSKLSPMTVEGLRENENHFRTRFEPMIRAAGEMTDPNMKRGAQALLDLSIRLFVADFVNGYPLSTNQIQDLMIAHESGTPPYSPAVLKQKTNILKRSFRPDVVNDLLRLGIAGKDVRLVLGTVDYDSGTTSHRESRLMNVSAEEAFQRAQTLPLSSFLVGPAKIMVLLFSREVFPETKTVLIKGPGDGAVVTVELRFRDDPENPGSTLMDDRVSKSMVGLINSGHYLITQPAEAIAESFRGP